MHSQGRALSTFLEREPHPHVEINSEDALDRGICDGNWVEITSPLGEVSMLASVADTIAPGIVHAVHGWAGHDINELIPDEGLDPISGFPSFKSSLCEVRKSTV